MVHVTHRADVQRYLEGPHRARYQLLEARVAHDGYELAQLVVAERQADVAGRHGVQDRRGCALAAAKDASDDDHGVDYDERWMHRLKNLARSVAAVLAGLSPLAHGVGIGSRPLRKTPARTASIAHEICSVLAGCFLIVPTSSE